MRSSGGVPGADGTVLAMAAWDPDGAGPLAPRLAVGGTCLTAGSVVANRVATFDPGSGTWAPFYVAPIRIHGMVPKHCCRLRSTPRRHSLRGTVGDV